MLTCESERGVCASVCGTVRVWACVWKRAWYVRVCVVCVCVCVRVCEIVLRLCVCVCVCVCVWVCTWVGSCVRVVRSNSSACVCCFVVLIRDRIPLSSFRTTRYLACTKGLVTASAIPMVASSKGTCVTSPDFPATNVRGGGASIGVRNCPTFRPHYYCVHVWVCVSDEWEKSMFPHPFEREKDVSTLNFFRIFRGLFHFFIFQVYEYYWIDTQPYTELHTAQHSRTHSHTTQLHTAIGPLGVDNSNSFLQGATENQRFPKTWRSGGQECAKSDPKRCKVEFFESCG
jgi:hypothetical protein